MIHWSPASFPYRTNARWGFDPFEASQSYHIASMARLSYVHPLTVPFSRTLNSTTLATQFLTDLWNEVRAVSKKTTRVGNKDMLSANGSKIKVLVSSRTPLTGHLIADALRHRGFVVEEANGTDIPTRATTLKPDVVLLSENLQGTRGRGLEVLKQLQTAVPETRSIVLLDPGESELVVETFRSGARGVFSRNDPIELLAKCVRKVYEGQFWISGAQMELLVDALVDTIGVRLTDAQGVALLSKREQDVVVCASKGCTNAEIARELRLSENTVRNYMFRIFDKLGVSSRVELVKYVADRSAPEAG